MHKGVFIDIFILHTCPDNKIKRYWQYFWAKYIILKGLANKDYNRRGGVINSIVKIMGKVLPKRFLLYYALKQVYRFRYDKTKYLCNYLGKALLKKGTYKRRYFDGVKRVSFETITLNVPILLEEFLIDRFGDYMKPPSKERIKYEQHSSTWNLNPIEYTDKSDEYFFI